MKARLGRWLPALSLALAVGAGPAPAQETPARSAEPLTLTLARWRAEALGRSACGLAGWILGSGGDLRWDLTVAEDPGSTLQSGDADDWAPLLTRTGHGWTLIAPASGTGVFGAWDREWAAPPAGLAALARRVATCVDNGPSRSTEGSRRLTLFSDPVAGDEPAAVTAAGRFREGMSHRGRGGGGPGEVVTVGARAAAGGVRVRSSRRPGWVEVTAVERRPAAGSADEVFLPWWSLGELTLPASLPPAGTSPSGRR